MPNYYAHLTFGQRVLADLPAGLSELIEQEREAFDLGCLGPDPLFFYQPIRPNAVRREGIKMHRRSALPAVERLRQAIEDGVPMSTGYGAGFLCHLALDSACHGYVDDRAADGPISHMAIEGEYDRMLMERDGLNAAEQSPLPSAPANRAVWEAASQAFVHASPDQMRRAYRSMAFFSGFLARSNGRMTGKVIGAVSHMLPIPSAKGIALKETPHPSAQESKPTSTVCWRRPSRRQRSRLPPFSRPFRRKLPCPAGSTGTSRAIRPPSPSASAGRTSQSTPLHDKRRPRIVGAALSHWASNRKVTGRSPSVQHTTLTPSRRCQGV